MCTVCGCAGDGETTMNADGHGHDHGHHHHHGHDHDHAHDHHHAYRHHGEAGLLDYGAGPARAHAPGLSQTRMIEIERGILAKNGEHAGEVRRRLAANYQFAVNFLSSPGTGKTTLLVETLARLKGRLSVAVIEGDQQTTNDAERIRAAGAPAIQVNTGKGCHLDAAMVWRALTVLAPEEGSLVLIENVGNLVCPAGFDLGEAKRVTLVSVTEGEDKPLKYPDAFANADLVLVTKSDLLPHLDFDLAALQANIARIAPHATTIEVSSRDGSGLEAWMDWLVDTRNDWIAGLVIEAERRAAAFRRTMAGTGA